MAWGDRLTARLGDRYRELIHGRLLPRLIEVGFVPNEAPGMLAVADGAGVRWIVDVEDAPWSTAHKWSFTLAWGVAVPGLEDALGDPAPAGSGIAGCVLSGRVGERDERLDPRWFELRALPPILAGIADAAVANQLVIAFAHDVLPILRELRTPSDVQRQLYGALVTGHGVPSSGELQAIRRIAALSVLVGDRHNAARWLDYLEARSASAMAPDVIAERLAPLRQRLAG